MRGAASRRVERAAEQRRQRAQAHLARVRARSARRARGGWGPRGAEAAVLGVSLLAGALAAPVVSVAALRLGAPAVERICVRGAQRFPAEAVAAATGVAPGAATASVDAGEVAARLGRVPWVAGARALQLPSGALLVEIAERTPEAIAAVGSPPVDFVVDASGTPFAAATPREQVELPRLSLREASARVGVSHPGLARAAALARRMTALGLPPPSEIGIAADTDPQGLAVSLPGLPAPAVLGWGDVDAALGRLARLLAADVPELEAASSLDLRFADQAVLRGGPLPRGGGTRGG